MEVSGQIRVPAILSRLNRRLGGVQTNLFPLPGIEIPSAHPVRIQPMQYKTAPINLPALFSMSDFERKKHP
jgi:hypothetical protein